MATVIDTLFLELGIDASKFSGEAAKAEKQYNRLEQSVVKTEKAEKSAAKVTKEHGEAQRKSTAEVGKADVQLGALVKTIKTAVKGFAAFTGMLLGASGLSKLAVDAAKANRELDTTAKNLGMARKELHAWQGAAEMAGGSAQGMSSYMKTLSGDMQSLIMMGDTSVLPYFNALGVSMLDSQGKARKLDDVMLDLADRFSSMDRQQAYTLAQQMGIDDGTFSTLSRGRIEMERMLAIQRDMYQSTEADIENSRKLSEARAVLNARWESLKLMLGNALIPVVTFLTEKVSAFVHFLSKNEHLTKGVFLGMATAISLFLIPMLVTATAATFAFIAPFIPLIAAVTALGAAFGLLYDDYKTWAEGGKSLFDWGRFISYIDNSKVSTESLGKSFIYLTTGYTSWAGAANGLLDWLKLKGFIDGNTVSVQSLTTGFKNLASEIADSLMPYLMDIVNIFDRLKEGDFSGAGEAVKVAAKRRWEAAKAIGGAVWDRMTGAVDVATGHEVGSLAGGGSSGNFVVNGGGKGKYKASNKNRHNQQIIAEEARKAGIDPSIMLAMAHIETGGSFNEKAKNPKSSASGLFQFMAYTRGRYGMDGRTVFDARMNSRGAAKMLNENRAALRKVLGREPTAGELYLAHQQGLGGARQLLSNPNGSALEAVARAHKGNYGLARKIIKLNGGNVNMSSGQFASLWIKKGNALQNAYQGNFVNRPLGGQAVAGNLQSQQTQIQAANSAAKPQQVSNQNSTQVTVNGGIHVKTTADTIRGNAEDAAAGLTGRIEQYAVAQG